jgi:hypothetical protein
MSNLNNSLLCNQPTNPPTKQKIDKLTTKSRLLHEELIVAHLMKLESSLSLSQQTDRYWMLYQPDEFSLHPQNLLL